MGGDDRYVIQAQLGDGTFGRVLQCRDSKTDRSVAVKVVKAVRQYCEHAEAEAEVLTQISHLDVKREGRCVQLLDAFLHGSLNFCMVFEPLDTSIRDFLKANDSVGLPMADVFEISRQLLESIAFLHSIEVVHTDLKCRNVMLRSGAFDVVPFQRGAPQAVTRKLRNVDVVLIDFGSACFPDDRHDGRVGTRQFRSPEIVLGLEWDEYADIWATGCIIGMLYLGQRIFSVHEDMEHLAMMEKAMGSPLPPLLLQAADDNGMVPETVSLSSSGALLWPSHAPDEEGVERVEVMKPLRQHIMDRHNDFYELCAGLLNLDPQRRVSATAALAAPFFSALPPE